MMILHTRLEITTRKREPRIFVVGKVAGDEWLGGRPTRSQGEIQGAYQIKVTTTALALLLSSRHEELVKVNVNGHLIKSNAGITTRSKAKLAPDQWTIIPLHAKIFSLLSDALVETQEQILDDDSGSDEDSDWEEVLDNNGCGLQDLLYQSNVPSKRNASVEHLNAMAKVFNELVTHFDLYIFKSDGDNSEEELVKDDPLNEVCTENAFYLENGFP
ncbi:hypothetical protein MA16_Dca018065 [Dendrobium catenatum]|uniref:Uncharacterized protein n=1 Tax=Dendrobium catenatum TaxID=906689 RepID=A0A2I0XI25_9ASPA|nr:hypothetical protein MA16_Dca018065 [Dendrobium catenatum]